MNKQLIVTQCLFNRSTSKSKSKTERGIAIGAQTGDISIILDKDLKLVKNIWNYTCLPGEGLLPIDLV